MEDETAEIAIDPPVAAGSPMPAIVERVRLGLGRMHNWVQLARFGVVGASGYLVNLATFTLLVHAAGVHYMVAALGAFGVAVTNNFALNRHWTFDARDGHMGRQYTRFFAVSIAALGLNLAVLEGLVALAELPEVGAQAIAIVCATPLSFVGNKLWTFGSRSRA